MFLGSERPASFILGEQPVRSNLRPKRWRLGLLWMETKSDWSRLNANQLQSKRLSSHQSAKQKSPGWWWRWDRETQKKPSQRSVGEKRQGYVRHYDVSQTNTNTDTDSRGSSAQNFCPTHQINALHLPLNGLTLFLNRPQANPLEGIKGVFIIILASCYHSLSSLSSRSFTPFWPSWVFEDWCN